MELRPHRKDFSLLPAHIITRILEYLPLRDLKTASSICKSWNYASNDPKIIRNLALIPSEKDFRKICKSSRHRKCGVLKLRNLEFDKIDSYYFKLFEIFCPSIYQLVISSCNIKLQHLFKLLELTTRLENLQIIFVDFSNIAYSPTSLNYCSGKDQIYNNLSNVKSMEFTWCCNLSLITDLVRCATNLTNLFINSELDVYIDYTYREICKIFDNDHIGNLQHLTLDVEYKEEYVNSFIANFVKIKCLNLRSFNLIITWNWKDDAYNSSLFREFILKLQNLVEFTVNDLEHDQLSIICQHLLNLKNFDCGFEGDAPFSEIGNLKQLVKLRCGDTDSNHYNFDEINKFFKYKFEHLRVFEFAAAVTESNLLHLCENHPNLIELILITLLTRNLGIIYKHLTKLRNLQIHVGIDILSKEERDNLPLDSIIGSSRDNEFKISRLHDLEILHIDDREIVMKFCEDDLQQLKKLRQTNLKRFRSDLDF